MKRRQFDDRSCVLCGETDPRVLKEEHHVFGRVNSPETIIVCRNCHDKITAVQNEASPSNRKADSDPIIKMAHKLRSIGSLNLRTGEELIKVSEEVLKYGEGRR
jgi:hypothetical protein